MTLKMERTFNGLPICEHCGWALAGPYEQERHLKCPLKREGKLAVALAERFPKIASAKNGYGQGQLVFEWSPDLHLHFTVRAESFSVRELYSLDSLTPDQAAELVHAIDLWRRRNGL